jgi:phosphohistidine phosphatase
MNDVIEPSTNGSEPVYDQAGVIPYRVRDGEVEVALITAIRSGRWVIPKGLIDPGEAAGESAAREAHEEAGLLGDVHDDAYGRYRYRKWGGVCDVRVFLMHVTRELDDWEESLLRDRAWYAPEDAADLVREPDLAALLRDVAAQVR